MYKRLLLPIIALCFLQSTLVAQKQKLFDSEEILELELTFDMEKLLANRSDTAPYQEAVLAWKENGEEKMISVEIKVRGNYRRHKTICEFPPIKVKTSKKKSKGTIFHKQGKLKLVPDCKGQDYVFREYLVYKSFNLLTDSSFKARLIRVTYKDSAKVLPSFRQYGFFIEDEDKLAKRLGGEIIKKQNKKAMATQKHQLGLVSMFQYMIGNPDWSVEEEKNIKLVQLDSQARPIIIPYDFDWSKAVDTPYALASMGEDYQRRKIPPVCFSRKESRAIIKEFVGIKDELIDLYKKGSPLKKALSKETLAYYDEFFEIISQPGTIEKILTEGCPQTQRSR